MADIEIPSLKQYVLGQWSQESQFTRRMVGNLTADLSPAELNWQSAPGTLCWNSLELTRRTMPL